MYLVILNFPYFRLQFLLLLHILIPVFGLIMKNCDYTDRMNNLSQFFFYLNHHVLQHEFSYYIRMFGCYNLMTIMHVCSPGNCFRAGGFLH